LETILKLRCGPGYALCGNAVMRHGAYRRPAWHGVA